MVLRLAALSYNVKALLLSITSETWIRGNVNSFQSDRMEEVELMNWRFLAFRRPFSLK